MAIPPANGSGNGMVTWKEVQRWLTIIALVVTVVGAMWIVRVEIATVKAQQDDIIRRMGVFEQRLDRLDERARVMDIEQLTAISEIQAVVARIETVLDSVAVRCERLEGGSG